MDDLTRPSFLGYRGPDPRLPGPPSTATTSMRAGSTRATLSATVREIDAGPLHVLGHVHLYWDPASRDEDPTCLGETCQVRCHQR